MVLGRQQAPRQRRTPMPRTTQQEQPVGLPTFKGMPVVQPKQPEQQTRENLMRMIRAVNMARARTIAEQTLEEMGQAETQLKSEGVPTEVYEEATAGMEREKPTKTIFGEIADLPASFPLFDLATRLAVRRHDPDAYAEYLHGKGRTEGRTVGDVFRPLITPVTTLVGKEEEVAQIEKERAIDTAQRGELSARQQYLYALGQAGFVDYDPAFTLTETPKVIESYEKAQQLREDISGLTDEEALVLMEEREPGSTQGYLEETIVTPLEIASFLPINTPARIIRMGNRILPQMMQVARTGIKQGITTRPTLQQGAHVARNAMDWAARTPRSVANVTRQIGQIRGGPNVQQGFIRISDDVIQFRGRDMIVAELPDGTRQPFYRRTGAGGDTPVAGKDSWVPFDGITKIKGQEWIDQYRFTELSKRPGNAEFYRYGSKEYKDIGDLIKKIDPQSRRVVDDAGRVNQWLGIGDQTFRPGGATGFPAVQPKFPNISEAARGLGSRIDESGRRILEAQPTGVAENFESEMLAARAKYARLDALPPTGSRREQIRRSLVRKNILPEAWMRPKDYEKVELRSNAFYDDLDANMTNPEFDMPSAKEVATQLVEEARDSGGKKWYNSVKLGKVKIAWDRTKTVRDNVVDFTEENLYDPITKEIRDHKRVEEGFSLQTVTLEKRVAQGAGLSLLDEKSFDEIIPGMFSSSKLRLGQDNKGTWVVEGLVKTNRRRPSQKGFSSVTDAPSVPWADFMEEAWRFKPKDRADFSDEFWRGRDLLMRYQDHHLNLVNESGMGRKLITVGRNDPEWFNPKTDSMTIKDGQYTYKQEKLPNFKKIEKVTWDDRKEKWLKGTDNLSYGARRSHYFHRGNAVTQDFDESLASFTELDGKPNARFAKHRAWDTQAESIEYGNSYPVSPSQTLSNYSRAAYTTRAGNDFSRNMRPLGRKLESVVNKVDIENRDRLNNLSKVYTSLSRTVADIKQQRRFPRAPFERTIKIDTAIKRAGFRNISEAWSVAQTRVGQRTEQQAEKWRNIQSDALKRLLRDSDEATLNDLPRDITETLFGENPTLRQLRDIMSSDDFDALKRAIDIKDNKTRRTLIDNIHDKYRRKKPKIRQDLQIARAKVNNVKARVESGQEHFRLGDKIDNVPGLDVAGLRDLYFPKGTWEMFARYGKESSDEWGGYLKKFNDWHRMIALTGDNAAPFNQGSYLYGYNPKLWVQTVARTFHAMLDPRGYEHEIIDNLDFWRMYVREGGSMGRSEYFKGLSRKGIGDLMENEGEFRKFWRSAVEEFPSAKLATTKAALNTIPDFGKSLAGELGAPFERSFNMLRDYGRRQLFLAMEPIWRAEGRSTGELVKWVDNLIGISHSVGVSRQQASIEAMVMLARGYYRANAVVLGALFQGTIRGQQARQIIARMQWYDTIMHVHLSRLMGEEPNLDPTKGNYLQVNVGGVVIGNPSIFRALMRTSAQLFQMGAQKVNPERYGYVEDNEIWQHPLVRLGRSRSSAVGKTLTTLLDGQDYMGKDISSLPDWVSYIVGDMFTPLTIQEHVFDRDRLNPLAFPVVFMGMMARQLSPLERLKKTRNDIARMEHGKSWYTSDAFAHGENETISETERQELISARRPDGTLLFPQLNDAEEEWKESLEDNEGRGLWRSYNQFRIKENESKDAMIRQYILQGSVEEEAKRVAQGKKPVDTKELREMAGIIKQTRASEYQNNIKNFPDVEEYFNRRKPREGEEYKPSLGLPPQDIAVDDYYRMVLLNPLLDTKDEDGRIVEFDYDLYNSLQQDWIDKWDQLTDGQGTDIWIDVQKIIDDDEELPPVWRELSRAQIYLKPYFRVEQEHARQQGLLEEWKAQTDSSYTGEKSSVIKRIISDADRAKLVMRRDNRKVDLLLYRFYDNKVFENLENQRDFATPEAKTAVRSLAFDTDAYLD